MPFTELIRGSLGKPIQIDSERQFELRRGLVFLLK